MLWVCYEMKTAKRGEAALYQLPEEYVKKCAEEPSANYKEPSAHDKKPSARDD
jgi:hypothetical protein